MARFAPHFFGGCSDPLEVLFWCEGVMKAGKREIRGKGKRKRAEEEKKLSSFFVRKEQERSGGTHTFGGPRAKEILGSRHALANTYLREKKSIIILNPVYRKYQYFRYFSVKTVYGKSYSLFTLITCTQIFAHGPRHVYFRGEI